MITSGQIRLVVAGEIEGRSGAFHDGPPLEVRMDPARPGFSSSLIWATGDAPPVLSRQVLPISFSHSLEPPPGGSLLRVVTYPPESSYLGAIGEEEVRAHFEAMGSPGASTYSTDSPHPYMQQIAALELCMVVEGQITLVLDTEEVELTAGDTVVQLGTNHAWSNRSSSPATVAISAHSARSRDSVNARLGAS